MNFYPSIVYWPRILQRDRRWTWELQARTMSGGRSLSGLMPTARVDGGGMWTANLEDVQVSTADQVRAWRALAARLDSGATPVAVAARDERHAPWPLIGGQPFTGQFDAAHSDDTTFSDGTDYVSDVIVAEVKTAAALRATALALIVENASDLRGGEYLSIQHDTFSHRLYRIGAVSGIDGRAHAVNQVTFTGSPATIACTAHGLGQAQQVFFRSSGALPAALQPVTIYYAIPLTADTFRVAATEANALSSPTVPITIIGAGTGTHRVVTGGLPTVTVRPPLREATAAGTRVEFDNPKCIMRLMDPGGMDLALERRIFGAPSVKLVEDFPPFALVEP